MAMIIALVVGMVLSEYIGGNIGDAIWTAALLAVTVLV